MPRLAARRGRRPWAPRGWAQRPGRDRGPTEDDEAGKRTIINNDAETLLDYFFKKKMIKLDPVKIPVGDYSGDRVLG